MTDTVPPALANVPQFTPEHWARVPRTTMVAQIERVTHIPLPDNAPEGFEQRTEIVLKGGLAFQRKRSEIKQLLTANMTVNVESIGNGKMITGLFCPDVKGWAFRMTNEDLADYTKKLAAFQHQQRRQAEDAMLGFLVRLLEEGFDELGIEASDERKMAACLHLAGKVMQGLEQGPQ